MLLAKIIGLQIFGATGAKEASNKLNPEMIKQIFSQVFNNVISVEAQKIETIIEKHKQDENDESG